MYPNPFDEWIQLDYHLLNAQYVTVSILNSLGQEINQISSSIESSGLHSHRWDGKNQQGLKMPSGVYIYKIQAGNKLMTGKVF